MTLEEFINNNDVDCTKNLINKADIESIVEKMNVSIGDQLKKYILRYGYLGYRHIEFYGMNSKQMNESDMITQTIYLHKYFPKTNCFIAFENIGDGNYAVVSSEDYVFEYSTEENKVYDTGYKLEEYILKRFQSI